MMSESRAKRSRAKTMILNLYSSHHIVQALAERDAKDHDRKQYRRFDERGSAELAGDRVGGGEHDVQDDPEAERVTLKLAFCG
jgi:hypothetical protein